MIGDDDDFADAEICPLILKTFGGKVVLTGPVGSGMAVKAINNVMNSAHLLVAAEGLLALRNFGVSPDVALEVINSSSGRSMATTDRVPQDVITGKFDYGFALNLMSKDCKIAADVMDVHFPEASLIKEVSSIMEKACNSPFGGSRDYTNAVKYLESIAKTDLRVEK
tara:strand:- start:188 stop:688 length:501 start_codon:yes stop_codon:yes gene_type:complete